MKTFSATHLNKHAQEVFAAAKDGPVLIRHDRYTGGVFTIVWNRNHSMEEILKVCDAMDSIDVNKDAC